MCDICVMNSVKERMLSPAVVLQGRGGGDCGGGAWDAATAPRGARGWAWRRGGHDPCLLRGLPDLGRRASGMSREKAFDFAADGFNLYQPDDQRAFRHPYRRTAAFLGRRAGGQRDPGVEFGLSRSAWWISPSARPGDADTMGDAGGSDGLDRGERRDTGRCLRGDAFGLGGQGTHGGLPQCRRCDGVQHYPGFHVEATQMLIEETGAASIAVDTLSLDHGASQDFATHYAWLPSNRYGIECLDGTRPGARRRARRWLSVRRKSWAGPADRRGSLRWCEGVFRIACAAIRLG